MPTARFKINGTPSEPRGFDATASQALTFELESPPSPDIWLTQYFVNVPADTSPTAPQASISGVPGTVAPALTLSPSNGVPAIPTGAVTTTFPASGIHTYEVRCVINSGVDPATGRVVPEWTFSRIVCRRSTLGIRKELPAESTEYVKRGWADEQNRMVDALTASGGSVPDFPLGSGDWTGAVGSNRVEKINRAAVPDATAGLTVGTLLRVVDGTPGAVVLGYGAADLANPNAVTGRLPIGNLAFGAANTLLRTNAAGNNTEYALAVNANIDPAAGIFVSKLAGGTDTYVLATVAGVPTWIPPGFGPGSLTPGAARQLLTTFAAGPAANWVTAGGDVSIPTTEGQFSVLALRGAVVGTAAGALTTGHLIRVTGLSAIDYGPLDLANTNSLANRLGLTYLAQGGAIANDVLRYDSGTGFWGPAAIGTLLPPSATALQIVADMPALEALPVGPLANRCMCIVQTPPRRYWLNKAGTPGASGVDDNVPASGGGRWEFEVAA